MELDPARDATWRASVLCRNCEDGWLNGPYLCGLLVHGRLALSSRDLDQQNGLRLWKDHSHNVPTQYLLVGTTKVHADGVLHLLDSFNHGFNSNFSDTSKQLLVSFLQLVPGGAAIAASVESYYAKCSVFMTLPEHLGSPPSYLDLFKDARINKTWLLPAGYQEHLVVIDAPNVLRVWPDLMAESWNSIHSWRDASTFWVNLQPAVEDYHNSIEQDASRAPINRVKNCKMFVVTV